jgi:biopolymer transport protein ExbB
MISPRPFLAALLLAAGATSAGARTPAAAAAMPTTVGGLVGAGGPAIWLCVLLSAGVTALAIEGFLRFRDEALVPPEDHRRVRELLDGGAPEAAAAYCRSNPSFFCAVAAAGLDRLAAGRGGVRLALEEASLRQQALLRRPLEALSAVAVLAPMIGLAGTVVGIARAFTALARSGSGDFPALASAIGQVLLSTAGGLLVAVPGFVFYYVYRNRAARVVQRADNALALLFEPFAAVPAGRRRARGSEGGGGEFGLQITPLLDLLFVLLLFFMIVAGARAGERELPLALNPTPTARAEGAGAGEAPARIEIEAGGQVFLNRVPVGGPRDALLPELRERLRAVRGAVRIEPNPRARQARLAAVLDACAAAGVARVSLQDPEE